MEIAVILRQVPDTEANIMVDPDNSTQIVTDDIKWVLNPYDEFAVEAAVTLAEDNDGEVTVICIGNDDAEQVIRTAMAMGADKGILINDETALGLDVVGQAKVLAGSLQDIEPELILCGREFIDTNEDGLGAALAQLMNLPHVLNITKLEYDDGTVSVEREIDGDTLKIDMELPGVLSCQKGLNEPRYPNLMAVRRARKKPMETLSLEDLDLEELTPGLQLLKLSSPPARAQGQIVEGTPEETARKAANWLQNDAKAF